jgi:hypothetical protein
MGNSNGKPVSFSDEGMQASVSYWKQSLQGQYQLASIVIASSNQKRLLTSGASHSEPQPFPLTACCREGCIRKGQDCREEGYATHLRLEVHP